MVLLSIVTLFNCSCRIQQTQTELSEEQLLWQGQISLSLHKQKELRERIEMVVLSIRQKTFDVAKSTSS